MIGISYYNIPIFAQLFQYTYEYNIFYKYKYYNKMQIKKKEVDYTQSLNN